MAAHVDKQMTPRRYTELPGRILVEDRPRALACMVRNISETGAKIEVASVAEIPNTFTICVLGDPMRHCRVVWRSQRELGVRFQTP